MFLSDLALVYAKYTELGRTNTYIRCLIEPYTWRMQNPQNPANLGDGINRQLLPTVDAPNQVAGENSADDALRIQPLIPCPQ